MAFFWPVFGLFADRPAAVASDEGVSPGSGGHRQFGGYGGLDKIFASDGDWTVQHGWRSWHGRQRPPRDRRTAAQLKLETA